MTWQEVESGSVARIGYDPDSRTLGVRFSNGGEYHYAGVSPEAHQQLLSADSIGRHINTHIKPIHQCRKV